MRKALGWLLVLHGLAHAGPGMWVSGRSSEWPVALLWVAATVGLLGAGFGLLGAGVFRHNPRVWALAGMLGSAPLLFQLRHPLMVPGLLLDLGILLLVMRWPGWQPPGDPAASRHPRLARLGTLAATVLVGYTGGVILLRPWHSSWGASGRDLEAVLPGDSLVPDAHYRIDHVITIHAPVERVWPWLAQIGQDRGGFYSHDWLENLIGADIHNADRIVPEWQHREAGELVRAVPAGWLGGRLGRDVGWRLAEVIPGRALVLEGWGAFVLEPVDSATTRFHVRTRGDGRPVLTGVFMAPFGLLVFEPAHFIMQRGMLRGVKARAERGSA